MAAFREVAARSVINCSHCVLSVVSRFGFKSGICLLIAPSPVHCFSITCIMFSR